MYVVVGVGGARYCNMENFNVTCAMDEVILIHSAKYGRMNIGRCVTAAYGYVGCSADVLPHLDRKCSGRRRCHFVVPDPAIYELRPCPEDLTSYLEVVYDCVKGQLLSSSRVVNQSVSQSINTSIGEHKKICVNSVA